MSTPVRLARFSPAADTQATASPFGRAVLFADGAFCVALGLGVMSGAGPLAAILGTGSRPLFLGLGLGVAAWGAFLLRGAVPGPARRWLVKLVLAANLAWVVASALALATGVLGLSPAGVRLVAVTGVAVLLFAALLGEALRRG